MKRHSISHTNHSQEEGMEEPIQLSCRAFLISLALAGVLMWLSGCSRRYSDMPAYLPISLVEYDNQSVGRFKSSYLAEQIDNFYRGTDPGPIGVTTFVNLDDLHATSSFGRMYAEQLMSELAMRGYDVVELRHSDALQYLGTEGEFALSRELGTVRREQRLGGVIVGTYVVSPVRVYVNARLIDPSSSLVLSAASVEMGKTTEIARLLRGGGVMTSLERIPVRHIGEAAYPAALPLQRKYALEEADEPVAPIRPEFPKKVGKEVH